MLMRECSCLFGALQMPRRVLLVLVRDGQDDVIVVKIPGDLRADGLCVQRRWRCRRRRCGCSRITGAAAASTSSSTTTSLRGTNTVTHRYDGDRMSCLRMHTGVLRTDVHIDVLEIVLPRR